MHTAGLLLFAEWVDTQVHFGTQRCRLRWGRSSHWYQPTPARQHHRPAIFKNERQEWSAANLDCAAKAAARGQDKK